MGVTPVAVRTARPSRGEAVSRRSVYLCAFYGLVSLTALIATWSQNLAYFAGGPQVSGLVSPFVTFVVETRANPATRSITVDLLFLTLAASAFMILEARRLGIRFVWAYVALGFLVAISVTFPLFMIARARHLTWCEGHTGREAAMPSPAPDILGIAVLVLTVLGLGAFILAG